VARSHTIDDWLNARLAPFHNRADQDIALVARGYGPASCCPAPMSLMILLDGADHEPLAGAIESF